MHTRKLNHRNEDEGAAGLLPLCDIFLILAIVFLLQQAPLPRVTAAPDVAIPDAASLQALTAEQRVRAVIRSDGTLLIPDLPAGILPLDYARMVTGEGKTLLISPDRPGFLLAPALDVFGELQRAGIRFAVLSEHSIPSNSPTEP